jgi:hypothetical protein
VVFFHRCRVRDGMFTEMEELMMLRAVESYTPCLIHEALEAFVARRANPAESESESVHSRECADGDEPSYSSTYVRSWDSEHYAESEQVQVRAPPAVVACGVGDNAGGGGGGDAGKRAECQTPPLAWKPPKPHVPCSHVPHKTFPLDPPPHPSQFIFQYIEV